MQRIQLFLLLILLSVPAMAQRYHFKYTKAEDRFDIRSEGNQFYCLFKISPKKASPTVFRKVFLNDQLQAIDSVEYSVNGVAELIATGSNERYSYHVFFTKIEKAELLEFVVTEKDGKIHATFTKSGLDFHSSFAKSSIKLKNLQFSIVDNFGSPDMLLLQLKLFSSSGLLPGLIALDIETGKERWVSNTPYLTNIQTTSDKIIGLSSPTSLYSNQNDYTIEFINKEDGRVTKAVPFYTGKSNRAISVVTTNGRELLLGGVEYPGNNAKNGQFFLTMFDLNGQRIFDKLDTAARLSSKRMRLMGHVFDKDGNLVLIGEGWKIDATRAIAATAGTVLAVAVLGGGYLGGINSNLDNKIDKLIFATVSPDDGIIRNFKVFPIGPYNNDFGTLITDGEHVLFEFRNNIFIYDPNDPQAPPKPFTSLTARENLLLASFGPVVISRDTRQKAMVVSLLPLGNGVH
jgi:hypothetical protein